MPGTPVDENLKGQYIDEFLRRRVRGAPNFVLGSKVTYRDLGRVIEDFLVIDDGGYFIANPAEGLRTTLTFYDYSTVAAPKAKRENWSVELTARKRFSNNWQVLTSYVWITLEGNYDGLFQNSTGQLDPNINSAFDYADFLINCRRPALERAHASVQVRRQLRGSPGCLDGMNLGLSSTWLSGFPLNAYGYSFGYANWEYYVVPRGSAAAARRTGKRTCT